MKHNFKPYLNPVFIETGSYGGDGIIAAVKAGFKTVLSIELSDFYYNLCVERYGTIPNVFLYHGDSAEVLPKILPGINERCTFWLDGHFCGGDSACGVLPVPLMEELNAIDRHSSIRNHTIMIDDIRLLRDQESEWKGLMYTLADVEKKIMKINPDYKIVYNRGLVSHDILIATV